MSFTAPIVRNGRVVRAEVKPRLGDGQRCLVCFETDPTKFAACDTGDCYAVGPFRPESEPGDFAPPKPKVSAFDLARRMRAKALSLDWDADAERTRLLSRARELEKGDAAEVPEEAF